MVKNKHVKPTEDMTDEDYFMLYVGDAETTDKKALRYLHNEIKKLKMK